MKIVILIVTFITNKNYKGNKGKLSYLFSKTEQSS